MLVFDFVMLEFVLGLQKFNNISTNIIFVNWAFLGASMAAVRKACLLARLLVFLLSCLVALLLGAKCPLEAF